MKIKQEMIKPNLKDVIRDGIISQQKKLKIELNLNWDDVILKIEMQICR